MDAPARFCQNGTTTTTTTTPDATLDAAWSGTATPDPRERGEVIALLANCSQEELRAASASVRSDGAWRWSDGDMRRRVANTAVRLTAMLRSLLRKGSVAFCRMQKIRTGVCYGWGVDVQASPAQHMRTLVVAMAVLISKEFPAAAAMTFWLRWGRGQYNVIDLRRPEGGKWRQHTTARGRTIGAECRAQFLLTLRVLFHQIRQGTKRSRSTPRAAIKFKLSPPPPPQLMPPAKRLCQRGGGGDFNATNTDTSFSVNAQRPPRGPS